MKRKRNKPAIREVDAELNIMPFIDIFSMLNTFLLLSAAFVNIGFIEVQLPFLTNAPPPKEKPPRSLDIHVAVEKDKLELNTSWSAPPEDVKKTEYKLTTDDLFKFHKDLVELRTSHPDFDKVNLHSEDDVPYKTLVQVLDEVMVKKQGDPLIQEVDKASGKKISIDFIYRKVIMAGVIL